ncbi:MAG: radical SAM protein [Candidatus Omnitrophica bacterium]|nr:radical SAM protein [Candidatus Omnitrophota bacterium]
MIKRKKITVKKIFNALYCYAAYFLKLKKSAVSPYLINFELWNECNERCVFCRTNEGEIYDANPDYPGQYIAKGAMRFEIFKGVISQVKDRLIMVVPYVNGEPLLSKDVYKVIQYASDNDIATMIATNGILLNGDNCAKLLGAGLDFIKIHISGFTQPTHRIEHREGDIELIKENLRCLARMNREGGYGMLIMLDYILYRHNKHELQRAREFSDELGIMFNVRRGYRKGLEHIEPSTPAPPSMADVPCDWLWTVLTIDWNGKILPCCDSVIWSGTGDYGCFLNGDTDILSIWNGPKAIAMRNTHLTKGRAPIPICSSCSRLGVKFKL